MPDQAARLQRQFGTAVRAARRSRGFTQRELAVRARLSENYIGEIERGRRMVTLITIVRVAAALQMRTTELFAEAGI